MILQETDYSHILKTLGDFYKKVSYKIYDMYLSSIPELLPLFKEYNIDKITFLSSIKLYDNEEVINIIKDYFRLIPDKVYTFDWHDWNDTGEYTLSIAEYEIIK